MRSLQTVGVPACLFRTLKILREFMIIICKRVNRSFLGTLTTTLMTQVKCRHRQSDFWFTKRVSVPCEFTVSIPNLGLKFLKKIEEQKR